MTSSNAVWEWDSTTQFPKLKHSTLPASVTQFIPSPAYSSNTASVYIAYDDVQSLGMQALLLDGTPVISSAGLASGSGVGTFNMYIGAASAYSVEGKPVFLTLRAFDNADPTTTLATALYTYVPSDYNSYYAEIKFEDAYEGKYYITGDKPKITAYYYIPQALYSVALQSYLETYNPTTGQTVETRSLQQSASLISGQTNVGSVTLEYSNTPTSGDYIARLKHLGQGTAPVTIAETDFYILTVLQPSGDIRIPNDELIYGSTLPSENSAAIFYDYYNMPFGGAIEVINTANDEVVHTQTLTASVEREGLNFRYTPTAVPPLGASGLTYQVKMYPYQSNGYYGPAVATKTFVQYREAPTYTLTASPQTLEYGQSTIINVTYANFVHGATLNITAELTTPISTNVTVGTTYSGSNIITYTPQYADTHYNITLQDGADIIAFTRIYVNPEPAAATLVVTPPNPQPGNTVSIAYTYTNFRNANGHIYVTPQTSQNSTSTHYSIGSSVNGNGTVQYTTQSSANLNYTVTIYDGSTLVQTVTFRTAPLNPTATISVSPAYPNAGEQVSLTYQYSDFIHSYAYMSISTPTIISPYTVSLGTTARGSGVIRYNPTAANATYTASIYDGLNSQTPIATVTFHVSNTTGTVISPLNREFWNLGSYDGTYSIDNYLQAVNWITGMSVPSSLVTFFNISTPAEYKLQHGLSDNDVGWFDSSIGAILDTIMYFATVVSFPFQYMFNVTYGVVLIFEDVLGWATTQLQIPIMIITLTTGLIPDEIMNVALLLFGMDLFFLCIRFISPGAVRAADGVKLIITKFGGEK